MSVEPRPIDLPLPGGRPGACVRLHPLLSGEMLSPPGLVRRPAGRFARLRAFRAPRSRWIDLPVPAFLVEHPGAGPILIDTGLHPSVAIDPAQNFGALWSRLLAFTFTEDQPVSRQIERLGSGRHDIGVVVMTHLHWDHASAVSEFPDATFVVDGAEWAAATTGRSKLSDGYLRSQFDFAFDWRSIDYTSGEIDSYATFGRSVDLFGDGSVRLLSTPGHTAGHQSVLLRLDGREALLTADAAYLRDTISDDVMPLLTQDEHRFRRSLREIRQFVDQAPGALVICGHDGPAWAELDSTY